MLPFMMFPHLFQDLVKTARVERSGNPQLGKRVIVNTVHTLQLAVSESMMVMQFTPYFMLKTVKSEFVHMASLSGYL